MVRENTTPEMLIMEGVKKGISVDTMERLLVIRREVNAEKAKAAFNFALSAFQAECPTIKKTKKVFNKKEKGGGLRYVFAPLDFIVEQVRPILQRNRLAFSIDAEVEEKWVTATCKITHELGHSEISTFKVPVDADAYMTASQKFGAALTFAKRYAFVNALGILTGGEDTDTNQSEKPVKDTGKALSINEKFQNALSIIKACKNKATIQQYYKDIQEKGPKVYNEKQMAELMDALMTKADELK